MGRTLKWQTKAPAMTGMARRASNRDFGIAAARVSSYRGKRHQ
jgi:hypothetical protein